MRGDLRKGKPTVDSAVASKTNISAVNSRDVFAFSFVPCPIKRLITGLQPRRDPLVGMHGLTLQCFHVRAEVATTSQCNSQLTTAFDPIQSLSGRHGKVVCFGPSFMAPSDVTWLGSIYKWAQTGHHICFENSSSTHFSGTPNKA